MKIVCPACERVAEILDFRVDGTTLLLTCAKCGTQSPVQGSSAGALPPSSVALTPDGSSTSTDHAAQPAPATPAAPPAADPWLAPAVPSLHAAPAPLPLQPSLSGAPPSRVVSLRPVTDAVQLAAAAAQSEDPFAVPEDHCPKCVGERPPDALFCPHCGLAWANFRPEQVEVPEELAKAFIHALAGWDEPERHEALLSLAARTGELPAVGRLYRLRWVAAPTDPIAQRGRDEVLRRAAATSEVLRVQSRPPALPNLARWALIAVGLMALFGALGLVMGLLGP